MIFSNCVSQIDFILIMCNVAADNYILRVKNAWHGTNSAYYTSRAFVLLLLLRHATALNSLQTCFYLTLATMTFT